MSLLRCRNALTRLAAQLRMQYAEPRACDG